MKILVIGHSVVDHIRKGNLISVKPGGIFYTVTALVKLAGVSDEINLLTNYDSKNLHLFFDIFSKVNTAYSEKVAAVPVVHLVIKETGEREECYGNICEKLKIDKIENLNKFDAVLINMITGFDIDVNDLEIIRKKFKGRIYLDIHTLSRDYGDKAIRNFRIIPGAAKWIAGADFIQVNESELKTLFDLKSEYEIAEEVLKCGEKVLIITKAGKGAKMYYLKNKNVNSLFIPAEKTEGLNKVGCGDVFGAAFLLAYFKKFSLTQALKKANLAAAFAAGNNFDKLENLF